MSNFSNDPNVQEFDDNQEFMPTDNMQQVNEREYNTNQPLQDRNMTNNDDMQQFANNVLNDINNNQHVQGNEREQPISPEYLYKEQELLLDRQMNNDKNANNIVEHREQPKIKSSNKLLLLYKPLSVVLIFLLLNNHYVKKNIGKYVPRLMNNNELNVTGLVLLALLGGILYYISHMIVSR